MTRWIRRLINMFRREQLERELEAELESHLGWRRTGTCGRGCLWPRRGGWHTLGWAAWSR